MKLILMHPDLKDNGGAYFYLSESEIHEIALEAHKQGVSILDMLQRKLLVNNPGGDEETPASENPHYEVNQKLSRLTARELEILRYVATGLGNKEIAETMGLKKQTVKNHLYHAFERINVPNRSAAAAYYIQNFCVSAKMPNAKTVVANTAIQ